MPGPSRRPAPAARTTTRHAVFAVAAIFALGMVSGSASAAPPPAPAWSPVATSGPTNLPPVQSEVQRLGIDAEGGTFTLTVRNIVARGTGDFNFASPTITNVATASGAFAVGQGIDAAGLAPGTTVTAVGSGTLTISPQPTGSGTAASLVASGALTNTTAPLSFDTGASGGVGPTASVENALNALPLISEGGGSVGVAGGPGGLDAASPYFVTFDGGPFANQNVPLLSADASALTGPAHNATVITAVPGGPGTGKIAIYAQNVGGLSSSGTTPVEVKVALPEGVETSATPGPSGFQSVWTCSSGAGQESFTCTSTAIIPPGLPRSPITAPVVTDADASGTKPVEVTVEGGGAPEAASYSMPLTVSSTPAEPGVQAFTAGAYKDNGELDTRAGGHPYAGSTAILVNTYRNHFGNVVPVEEFKDIEVDLPPGFLGNPIATPQCPETEFASCAADTIVGQAAPVLGFGGGGAVAPVFNVKAPFGYPGKFYFNVLGVPIQAVGSLRSDGDYGLTVGSLNTAQIANIYGSFFTFWGAPADPSHDSQRCPLGGINGTGICDPPVPYTGSEETAFLTSPVDCAREALEPPITRLRVTLWQSPLVTHESSVPIEPVTGCDQLHFAADFKFEPSDTKSDSPASFRTELTVPEEGLTNPAKLTTPEIKTSVVGLPKGVVLNASAADGLGSCSEAQIGLKNAIDPATGLPKPLAMPNPIRFSKDPNQCPDASKIGTGELKSALLENPLKGALYLAAQGKGNPFGSLFALYLVIEDPQTGIFIKLPGEVEVDERTGQMSVRFQNLPQLPFTYLRLNLKGGNRSPLASPTTCGNYLTTAVNTPWSAPESGPPTESSNGFDINQGPNGMPCAKTPAERPFDLGWKAGADSTQAGASGPFSFQITRPDGSQELDSLQLTTPPGLSASLKGIPYCSEAQIKAIEASTGTQEQEHPACPAASQVGSAITAAGSGPTPFYTSGRLYLAGPYKGAPISVLAVTPAVAGPFDLGNVVVRSAVFINRTSAQVSAKTDPIPQFLKGVALRIRDVRILLNHKDWTLNPTSCEPLTVNLTAHGSSGAVANRTTRFQVGGCGKLKFKPKLRAHLKGGTKRGKHPAFTAVLTYPEGPGYANIKDVQVALPHSEFLEQAHINTICTRPQAAAHQCPAGSIYGYAEATTPLLDGKLTGPVFLKSSDHQLPDLAIALRGPDNQPVEVEFQGRIDSVKGQIRNTIEGLPDVPVSKFVLKMKGGKKGLLVNSRNLCQGKPGRMTVKMSGQNNRTADSRPLLGNSCGAHKKAKKHRSSHSKGKGGLARHGRAQLSDLISIW
jgi:hypothetical protein